MKYFKQYFTDVDFHEGAREVKVLCPFHEDTNPSASINVEKSLFKCWVCGEGYSEQQFIAKVNNISMMEAGKILAKLNDVNVHDWNLVEKANFWANEHFIKHVENLGLSRKLMDDMNLGIVKDAMQQLYLGVPVFYDGILMDVRAYNILKIKGVPKWQSNLSAQTGFIIPHKEWTENTEKVYLVEGEKDMLIARENGINAYTLTGGAGVVPNEFVINSFKDKEIVLCYDNDEAGVNGMRKLCKTLKHLCKSIRYINISEVCKGDKEDIWDFFMVYRKDVFDFLSLTEYEFSEDEIEVNYISLRAALTNNNIKKELVSKVTISAEFEDNYAVPTQVEFEKIGDEKDNDTMMKGEVKSWFLEKDNIYQLLGIIEASATKENVNAKLKQYAGIPTKEHGIKMTPKSYMTIYKARIIDDNLDESNASLDIYTFRPVEMGKRYIFTYKIYPHPTKNQKLVAIATDVIDCDNQETFKPVPELLRQFQSSGTIEDKVQRLYQSAKHHIAKHLDFNLWLMNDLVFNSVLEIDYGERIKGALDIFILGDTQVGKSETASKLVALYDFGKFLSLKTSTTVGLIGGSTKIDNNWANTIGAIPRQHKKLVVMEEFSGAKPDFIKTMTDIRSSGMLRLARAAGEINTPCRLRMITISNPINDENGNPRFLSTFPNGITPLMELVKSAEDVARYDGFLLMPKPHKRLNPFAVTLSGTPIPREAYQHKAQWVYTRKPEDVMFEEGVESFIWDKAEELNNDFECNFPVFGTTTSLKLARFSVAMACLVMSTDANFAKVIVTKDIVTYTANYLRKVYDNPVFKLKEYKAEFDSYNTVDVGVINVLQELYNKNATILEFLESQAQTTRMNLKTISGLDGDKFNPVFNQMVANKLIRLSGDNVFPTERFRLCMRKINKNIVLDQGQPLVKVA